MLCPIIAHLFSKAVTHKMSFKTVSQKHAKLSCKHLQYMSAKVRLINTINDFVKKMTKLLMKQKNISSVRGLKVICVGDFI